MRQRRDPRLERARQRREAGLRPRFLMHALPESMRRRIDPRIVRAAARLPGAGRPRFDWWHADTSSGEKSVVAAKARPRERVCTVVDPTAWIIVVAAAEHASLSRYDRQLLGAARLLAGADNGVLVLSPHYVFADAGRAGADRVLAWPQGSQPDDDPEGAANWLAEIIIQIAPRHVIFAEAGASADLARRVAATLDEPLFTDAERVARDGFGRAARAHSEEWRQPPTRLITVLPDMSAAYAGELREASAWDGAATPSPPMRGRLQRQSLPRDAAHLSLAEAPFVISAGNGVTDFEGFRRLATSLDAVAAGSRVVCDAGLLPRDRQVGASGTVLSAQTYLALGISGAPQHLQGLIGVEHVIAINTDLHAAMVARAELAIIADAQPIMQAMQRLLERQAQEGSG